MSFDVLPLDDDFDSSPVLGEDELGGYHPDYWSNETLHRFSVEQESSKKGHHSAGGVLEKIKYGLEGGIVSALEHLDKPNDHRRHHKHFGSLKDSLRGAYYCSLVDPRRQLYVLGELFLGERYACFLGSRVTRDGQYNHSTELKKHVKLVLPYEDVSCIIKANLGEAPAKSPRSALAQEYTDGFPIVVPLNVYDDKPRVIQYYMSQTREVHSFCGMGPSYDESYKKSISSWYSINGWSSNRANGVTWFRRRAAADKPEPKLSVLEGSEWSETY